MLETNFSEIVAMFPKKCQFSWGDILHMIILTVQNQSAVSSESGVTLFYYFREIKPVTIRVEFVLL